MGRRGRKKRESVVLHRVCSYLCVHYLYGMANENRLGVVR
jgi:hypothetical protein